MRLAPRDDLDHQIMGTLSSGTIRSTDSKKRKWNNVIVTGVLPGIS